MKLPTPSKKYLIVIAGPTAAGKTKVAIELSKYFHTEIISADSRQIFKELNIGVARPSEEELQQATHHFITNKNINTYFSAGEYEREVLALLDNLFNSHDVVILCGGTGFYINAVLNGFDEIPEVDAQIRKELNHQLETAGIAALQEQLKKLDETTYRTIDLQNTQRVIRALEVSIGTGIPFSTFKNKKKNTRNFIPIKIGITLPKEQLHLQINQRVEKMMQNGFLEEAKTVYPYRQHNALQTVGYKELFSFMEGKTTLHAAVELIKLHTRQYAKRQLTFFNKHQDYTWIAPTDISAIVETIEQQMQ
ncbi:MAG TPA: tRNA (adenosine(37)-N6)-dimethylallyltransferase MiaA [Chitinophagales bacterium]|nr:tRNA (adenosine(37)-N6)-dimethylallyltransferase MiaA [Chitinophagales bacterium]HNM31903.1 tRNA (adenosine(37)-N6)-dimethylallyltransferase MiaA [Chitinophagales bacterium]